jgi:uncharacterized protein YlzI (FlbEa/FlbD family)
MMILLKQDVNLYQREEKFVPVLSTTRLLQVWLFLCIILGMIAGQQKWLAATQINKIHQLKINQEIVNGQLVSLSKNVKIKKNSQVLKEELAQVQEKIDKIEREIALLQKEEDRKTYPLSAYLEGLAIQHVKGTYVSYFYMQNKGNKIAFDGIALQPELVPQMVQSWKQSEPLRGKSFQKLQIKQVKQNTKWVQFNLKAE